MPDPKSIFTRARPNLVRSTTSTHPTARHSERINSQQRPAPLRRHSESGSPLSPPATLSSISKAARFPDESDHLIPVPSTDATTDFVVPPRPRDKRTDRRTRDGATTTDLHDGTGGGGGGLIDGSAGHQSATHSKRDTVISAASLQSEAVTPSSLLSSTGDGLEKGAEAATAAQTSSASTFLFTPNYRPSFNPNHTSPTPSIAVSPPTLHQRPRRTPRKSVDYRGGFTTPSFTTSTRTRHGHKLNETTIAHPTNPPSTGIAAGAKRSSDAVALTPPPGASATTQGTNSLADHRGRRPALPPTSRSDESRPLRKRLRRDFHSRYTLGSLDFLEAPQAVTSDPQPPSPLFFSHSPNIRPELPPRFSSSDAAVEMLNRAQGEDQGIKTVTLPRAVLGSPTARPAPHRSRFSSERKSQSRMTDSPDPSDRLDISPILSSVGVTELLEQDDRPTFIVDLGDPSNHKSSTFHVIYANASLKLYASILDVVTGRTIDDEGLGASVQGYMQFKNWVLAQYAPGERSVSTMTYASVSWSCSTLRRRIRVVAGNAKGPSFSATAGWIDKKAPMASLQSPEFAGQNSLDASSAGTVQSAGAQDYFGQHAFSSTDQGALTPTVPNQVVSAVQAANAAAAGTQNTDVVPSVEQNAEKGNETGLVPMEQDTSSALTLVDQPEIDMGFFDWTRLPITDALPPHIRFARSVDWGSTALGPIETWNADLRQMCNLIMASPHPAAMYWSDDLVAIYNEAYVPLAGQKHPRLMGQSYSEAWAEIWDEVKDVFANAQTTGEATMKDDDCLFINRGTFLEETYFSWSIIPMVGGDGSVMGLYNPAFEKTRRKIAERRMLTLREVGERTATARDVKSFWEEVLGALECNEFDTPFVLLYSLFDEAESDEMSINSSSITSSRQCLLEGALGVPEGHAAAPTSVDFQTSEEGFVPVFREVLKTNKPRLLYADDGEIPEHLLDGLEWRGFGDASRTVVICPIHPTTGESTLGFLVMGVNPRRPYDDDYNLFVQLLGRQLATSLASVVLFEEEIKRGRRAAKLAAIDRMELSEQLAVRTAQAIESETKFTRMAEMAPVGMLIADHGGRITFCNDTWYDISRVPKRREATERWMDYVLDEDKAMVVQLWNNVIERMKSVSAEFRFKAPWVDRHGITGPTWVLFSAFPEPDLDGRLKSVFGSITNISQQKWAEDIQKRKTEEAVELKRQQENFIDITSHEMRNPLSAILQCADEISSSLIKGKASLGEDSDSSLFDDNIDAAHTITLCAQHQKRIVDDVLTMSKLDSQLLMVTPVDVQPLTVAQRALKMFEGELQTADIQMKFIVDDSFKELAVDWCRFDPSRVLQVLINLTTNAIKFTTSEDQRTIVVSIAASLERPSEVSNPIVDYVPTRADVQAMPSNLGWGGGDEIYILFAVQDTGRGLTKEEKKLLFQRFSQASPRTHVQYGGSGLGLFISKELTELQGGQIGVASESGKGSTFAFFIKARRSIPNAGTPGLEGVPPPFLRKLTSGDSKASSTQSNTSIKAATLPKARDFAENKGAESPKKAVNSTTNGKASTSQKSGTQDGKQALKVLIVEDNLVNQRVLQKQLKNLGCITHVANHGGEALEQLKESFFWAGREKDGTPLSVVLMDQEMPVMDGLTCTRKIRQLEREGMLTTHVPIIAVTANARSEQIKTAMDAGMDDVVSKPFRIPELIPKIEELVEKYRLHAITDD